MFDTLLAWVALAEGLGIFTLAGLMLLHALGLSLLKKHSRRRVERARARLLAYLEAQDVTSGVPEDVPGKLIEHLRALTRGQQVHLFSQIIPNLKGSRRNALTQLAGDIRLTDWAERLCQSRRWWRRLQGIRLLTPNPPMDPDGGREDSGRSEGVTGAMIRARIRVDGRLAGGRRRFWGRRWRSAVAVLSEMAG